MPFNNDGLSINPYFMSGSSTKGVNKNPMRLIEPEFLSGFLKGKKQLKIEFSRSELFKIHVLIKSIFIPVDHCDPYYGDWVWYPQSDRKCWFSYQGTPEECEQWAKDKISEFKKNLSDYLERINHATPSKKE